MVHRKERLLRHGRLAPLRGVQIGVREVERPHCGGEKLAVNQSVQRSASIVASGRKEFGGATADRGIQLARNREKRVAPLFEGQPSGVHPPQQTILRINRQRLLTRNGIMRTLRLLLIRGR